MHGQLLPDVSKALFSRAQNAYGVTLSGKAVFTFCETACRYILATVLSTDHCKYTSKFECYIIVRFFFLILHCIGF